MLFYYFPSDTIGHMRNIVEIAYDSNWYDYPPEFRKYIILIVAKSQEDSEFSGLNLMGCAIEVLGNVNICIFLFFSLIINK